MTVLRRWFLLLLPVSSLLLLSLMLAGTQGPRTPSAALRSRAAGGRAAAPARPVEKTGGRRGDDRDATGRAIIPAYTLRDLGTLGGPASVAVGLNQAGAVVGYSADTRGVRRAFLADEKGMQPLPFPSDGVADVSAINALGDVVGQCRIGRGARYAFWYADGRITRLGTFGGTFSAARALNDTGLIVGMATNVGNREWRAFLLRDGKLQDLGTLGGSGSEAFAINNHGDVVGWAETRYDWNRHAFLYSGGAMQDLGALGGGDSQALGINDAGEIVGWAHNSGGDERAFLYREAEMWDLDTPAGTISRAFAINNAGQVVGTFTTLGSAAHAFLYQDARLHDLNHLIPAGSGWQVTEARAINDAGQIAAIGNRSGVTHALLLTPRASG
jgi:probable HAF family extracellular repeat protein